MAAPTTKETLTNTAVHRPYLLVVTVSRDLTVDVCVMRGHNYRRSRLHHSYATEVGLWEKDVGFASQFSPLPQLQQQQQQVWCHNSLHAVVAVAKLGERVGVIRVHNVFGQNNSTESSMVIYYWQGIFKFDCVAFQYLIVYS